MTQHPRVDTCLVTIYESIFFFSFFVSGQKDD